MAFFEDILNGLTQPAPRPAFGSMAVKPQAPTSTTGVAPPKVAQSSTGWDDMATFLAGMGEGGGALLPALGSGARAVSQEGKRREAVNQTKDFLLRNGVSPEDADATMANPDLLKLKLGQIFAPAAKPDIREVGGRLVRVGPNGAEEIYAAPDSTKSDIREVGGRLVKVDGDRAVPIYEPPQATTGPYKDAKQLAEVEEGLRKEHTTAAKDFTIIRDGLRRVQTGSKIDSGAGDLAVVYGYMKMLDPGSVVREGEFATAEQTTGVPSYILNLYNKIVNGDRLPAGAREKFSTASKALYDNAAQQYGQTRSYYEGLARRKDLDPRNVINDPSNVETPEAKRPEDMSNEELLLQLNQGAR